MNEIYVRNIIFGIADSLVSTVGLLSGIGVSGTPRSAIILTGIVYAFVEAFSMAVGSFLSERSAADYRAKAETSDAQPVIGGTVMFISFVLASFIPILPYFLQNLTLAFWLSIGSSIAALFVVGIVIAKFSKISLITHGLRMALLGGAAIMIGVLVGKMIKIG